MPLAVDFQDLFAVSLFQPKLLQPFPPVQAFLLNRYRFLNKNAEVVFHIGDEMKSWFTPHCRGEILYPIADPVSAFPQLPARAHVPSGVVKLVYTGNCSGAYGRMLLQLAEVAHGEPRLDLKIFSRGTDWPPEATRRLEKAGIYQGFLPF